MTALEFIASLVESLAWPTAVIVLVILLREDLSKILSRLVRLKHNDTELEFESELDRVSKDAESMNLELASSVRTEKYKNLEPRQAVLEAWLGIEGLLVRRISEKGDEPDCYVPHSYLGSKSTLTEVGLTLEQYRLTQELRSLRNKAAHAPDFSLSAEATSRYVQLASSLYEQLSKQFAP